MMAPNAVGGVSRLERERLTFGLGGEQECELSADCVEKVEFAFPGRKVRV